MSDKFQTKKRSICRRAQALTMDAKLMLRAMNKKEAIELWHESRKFECKSSLWNAGRARNAREQSDTV